MQQKEPTFREIIERLTSNTKRYIQSQTKSAQLEIYEGLTNLVSAGINAVIVGVIALFVLFFVNIGVAQLIGEQLGRVSLGYLIVAGFYLLILIVYLLINRQSKKSNRFKNVILKQVSKTHTDFDALLQEQEIVKGEKEVAWQAVQNDVDELKVKIYGDEQDETLNEEETSFLPRPLLSSAIDFAFKRFVFKRKTNFNNKLRPLLVELLVETAVFSEQKLKHFFKRSEKEEQ
ncbi:MAG: phage holin family protein [Crocinitomicaceae bacterium]|nr:phage holin family protein [Crocinitomicaceae bacterium]